MSYLATRTPIAGTKAGLIQWFLNTDYDRIIQESTEPKPQKQGLIDSLGNLAKRAIELGQSSVITFSSL